MRGSVRGVSSDRHSYRVESRDSLVEPKKNLDFNLVEIEGERILLSPISSSFSEDIFREFTSEITRYMFPASPTELS